MKQPCLWTRLVEEEIRHDTKFTFIYFLIFLFLLLDVASHLHGLAFFNVTQNQQKQNLLKPNKTKNAHFINKIICLLKLINFLFTHLKLILMNFNYKIINIK